MTWQLASFALLAIALSGGFAWYERSRPDARVIALVGVLAAFAALGRIAFAPLPNVKPTTDIVLISGYALGGAPGFVIGALAALTSNFFFGQGPWTPWQMAAWAATGALGAGLARITAGRIGRWPLALACALVGYGFTAVQDIGDWVNYSDHSLVALGVYVGKGTGFDFVHAAGCLIFALAFGPALARSIGRFAARLNVTWRTLDHPAAPIVIAIACAFGLAGAPTPARAGSDPAGYLLAAQNSDGGLGAAPGQSSSPLFSGWAALGLASAGHSPAAASRSGASLLAYVESSPVGDVGSLERTILVLRAAGHPVGGRLASLQQHVRPDGSVSDQVNLTAFAVLALRAAGATPPSATTRWLAAQQDSDGGFSFSSSGGASDVDDTGAALEALGPNRRAVAFIGAAQNSDGGFPSSPGADSNAQSTAWAVQGLIASGVGLGSLPHGSPLGYLRSLIAPDGHVRYSSAIDQTPVWVTGQALMALEGKPLPLAAPAQSPVARSRSHAHRFHGSAARHLRRSSRRPAVRSSIPAVVSRLAVDAGIATAVALAPVGFA